MAAIATALSTVGATPFNASGRSALRKILAVLRDVDADGARALAPRIDVLDNKCLGRPRPPAAVEDAILSAADMGLADITRLTIYATDVEIEATVAD